MATSYKQELPPSGGFSRITFARNIIKRGPNGYGCFGLFLGITAGSLYLYVLNYKRIMRERLENNDSRVALQPFILAERNRMLLRQMRRIRDEENELMKGVAGWETGTLYGEPVYHTTDPDEWTEPTLGELWTHASEKNIKERESWAFWV